MRKTSRGSDPAFTATHPGQAHTLDVGLMFQRSKNTKYDDILTVLNGCNTYCIVYKLKMELLFGIKSKGNKLSLS
jgi:hypothetical protein